MSRRELELLFHELEMEAKRLRTWADNIRFCMGMDYGVGPDDKRRPGFLEVTSSITLAAKQLDNASSLLKNVID